MIKSAELKITRATERIAELSELVEKRPPFVYMVAANKGTGYFSTWAKGDDAAINDFALIAGDAVHNLRTAPDHVYWDIVAPRVSAEERTQRNIQFPFSEIGERFEDLAKNRLAHRVSDRFLRAVVDLKPYLEVGGDNLLYILHRMDIIDRHRFLTPVADRTEISRDEFSKLLPGFRFPFQSVSFSQNNIDMVVMGTGGGGGEIIERKLDIPVTILLVIDKPSYWGPAIPTLLQLVTVTKESIAALYVATS